MIHETGRPKQRKKRVVAKGERSSQRENPGVFTSPEVSANRKSGFGITNNSDGRKGSQSQHKAAVARNIPLSGGTSKSRRERVLSPIKLQPSRGSLTHYVLPTLKEPFKDATLDTLDMAQPDPMLPMARRYAVNLEATINAVLYHYRLSPHKPIRISPETLDTAFLNHWLEHNKDTCTSTPETQWLAHLPGLLDNTNKPRVKTSLRAMSMAFYGKLHRDPSILLDSWRWYSETMNAQRTSIASLRRNAIPDEEHIIIPLILALYKTYIDDSPSSPIVHLTAATNIMNIRGPSNCKSGAMLTLLKGLRKSDVRTLRPT